MMLEDFARTYGMKDYFDINNGKIYELSKANVAPYNNCELLVPVRVVTNAGNVLIGHARMQKVY